MPTRFTDSLRRCALVVTAVVVSLLGAIGQARAAADLPAATPSQATSQPAFQQAFQHFIEASNGNNDAVDRSADEFNALLQSEPGNPVLMAYAGSTIAMKARTTMMPWKKMGYAEDGMAMLDKALAILKPEHDAPIEHGTPGSLEVRFVAASTFLAVPGFMNRGARGTRLLNDVLASPLLAAAPLPFRGNVWMLAAKQATKEQRVDDARRYLNEVVTSNAPQADKARALLKGEAT